MGKTLKCDKCGDKLIGYVFWIGDDQDDDWDEFDEVEGPFCDDCSIDHDWSRVEEMSFAGNDLLEAVHKEGIRRIRSSFAKVDFTDVGFSLSDRDCEFEDRQVRFGALPRSRGLKAFLAKPMDDVWVGISGKDLIAKTSPPLERFSQSREILRLPLPKQKEQESTARAMVNSVALWFATEA